MAFQFSNLSEFLLMGGHGPFVWASYIVTLLALVLIAWIPFYQRKQLFKQLNRRQRIAEGHQQATRG